MKKYFFVILSIGVLISGYYLIFNIIAGETNLEQESAVEVFETANVSNLEFSYKKSPDGYVLINGVVAWPENIISSISLFSKQDYEWVSKPGFVGGGPPTLTISVFKNENKLSPIEWVEANPSAANFELDQISPVLPTSISDVGGITYSFFGMFLFEAFVFSYKEEMYLLSVAYYDVGDKYHTDFKELISTAAFK